MPINPNAVQNNLQNYKLLFLQSMRITVKLLLKISQVYSLSRKREVIAMLVFVCVCISDGGVLWFITLYDEFVAHNPLINLLWQGYCKIRHSPNTCLVKWYAK